jgi:hypothetical protein
VNIKGGSLKMELVFGLILFVVFLRGFILHVSEEKSNDVTDKVMFMASLRSLVINRPDDDDEDPEDDEIMDNWDEFYGDDSPTFEPINRKTFVSNKKVAARPTKKSS